jgi:hypothetical protein
VIYRKGDHVRWSKRHVMQWLSGTVVEEVTHDTGPVTIVIGWHNCPAKYRYYARFTIDHGRVQHR